MQVDAELLDDIKKFALFLEQPRDIVIVSHINPDGDAIGSSLGLYHYLRKQGHSVSVIIPNDYPDFLAWLPDALQICVYQNNQKKAKALIYKSDIIICVDFNDFKRLKDFGFVIGSANAIKAIIDHHPEPDNVFTYNIHRTAAAATAELIYKLIVESGNRKLLDKTIAQCIYTGIMTDTGCFNHNASNPETFSIVADLLTTGFDKDLTHSMVYDNFSEHRMKLLGHCLNNRMHVIHDLHAAIIPLSKEDMEQYRFQTGDSEGFVNIPFSIKGIFISALITEKKDHVRISLRSRGTFAVNKICEKYFEGGGHRNAAGGESKLSFTDTIKHLETILAEYKDEIKQHIWPV